MRHPRSKVLCLAAAAALLQVCALNAHGQQGASSETRQRLFVPWADIALDVELPGLIMSPLEVTEGPRAESAAAAERQPAGDGPARRAREFVTLLAPGGEGLSKMNTLRIRLDPVPEGSAAEALRADALASYAKNRYVNRGGVKQDAYKQTPLLRYRLSGMTPLDVVSVGPGGVASIPGVVGLPSSLRVLEAFVVRGGAGVTLRFMSPELKGKDEQFFYSILDSLRFVDTSKSSSSYDYYLLGRDLYKRKEHGAAVAALEKGFAVEAQKRELTRAQWREMVMTLANALSGANDLGRAREVLEYGVAEEPTYPFFHHGLSHLYAHLGDLERTLSELEKTYQLVPKEKNVSGWTVPDPLEDPGYVKFAGDAGFRDGVKALRKKYKR
jgi:tetratricopeptide (TPR) repeat protein